MVEIFKKFFSKIISHKKQLTFLFLLFVILGLVLPTFVSAQYLSGFWQSLSVLWKSPSAIAKGFLMALQAGTFTILATITGTLLFLSQSLLNWVMSPGFINVPFTDNVFVNEGWRIVRDLTNILIVLGLVGIALATILRIGSYHAKKTLPLLLVVALLVNFSPVICGIMIDASNIAMNYFLKGGGLSRSFTKILGDEISDLWSPGISETERLGRGIVFIGFNIVGALIFLLFAFLFLFRYIALWMLVILSPVAFFCYIFPFTKKYWTMWWNQFFQWCIIGIPAAFSIYLSNQIITLLNTGGLVSDAPGELSHFAVIMGYIVPIAFLTVGFYMSLQTGAAGANIAIKGFQWTAAKGWAGTKWVGKRATRKGREKLGTAMEGAKGPIKRAEGESLLKHGLKFAPRTFSWAMRETGVARQLTAGAAEASREDIEKAKKAAKGKSLEKQYAGLKSKLPSVRIGNLEAAIKDKNLKSLRKVLGLKDEDVEKIMRDALRLFPAKFGEFADEEPEIAQKIAGETGNKLKEPLAKKAGVFMDENDKEKFKTLAEMIKAIIKPSKIENWSKETMKKALESETFHKFMTPAHIAELAKNFGKEFFDAWKEQAATKGWYENDNAPIDKYIESGAGRFLGIDYGEKKTPGTPPKEKEGEEEKKEKARRMGDIRGRGGVGVFKPKESTPSSPAEEKTIEMEPDKKTETWKRKKGPPGRGGVGA